MGRTILFPEQELTGFSYYSAYGAYHLGVNPAPFNLGEGEACTIRWDGTDYTCTVQIVTGQVGTGAVIGNAAPVGGAGNDEPFLILMGENGVSFLTFDGAASHTVGLWQKTQDEAEDLVGTGVELLIRSGTLTAIGDAIRAKTGQASAIPVPEMPARILGITTGGSSDDVRYVTFVSHDGSVEYGKKAVALGDDCADPIARGIFATPTRESTAQYDYTFMGWAAAAYGSPGSSVLKAVTEDRTVYASFAAAVRYYTVTYYDGDTVLKTESLAYGTLPSYVGVKVGFTFTGWEPAVTPVTGDAVYHAGWIEKMDFSALTWEQISAFCASEDVSKLFDLGAKKQFTYTVGYGPETATAEIVGFYKDDLADGSGKAPITLKLNGWRPGACIWSAGGTTVRNAVTWEECDIRRIIRMFDGSGSYGPETALNAIIKPVRKKYRDLSGEYITTEDRLFLPSMSELGFELDGWDEGTCYDAFSAEKTVGQPCADLVHTDDAGTAYSYWTRSKSHSGYVYAVYQNGSANPHDQASQAHYCLCFICIG